MKIINPLSVNEKKEHISTVLFTLAGQNNCDGVPYDQMQIAGEYIRELEKEIKNIKHNERKELTMIAHNLIGSISPLMARFTHAKEQLMQEGYKISAGSWIDEEIGRYYVCSTETVGNYGHPATEISGNEKSAWRSYPDYHK